MNFIGGCEAVSLFIHFSQFLSQEVILGCLALNAVAGPCKQQLGIVSEFLF